MEIPLERAIRRIDAHVRNTLRVRAMPGLTIALTDSERTLWVGTYGHADISLKTPVKKDTLFQIGSISKSFASMVVLQMQEEGLLSIDDPVSKHLPWLKIKSKYGPVTLKHLMSHAGGLMLGTDFTMSGYSEALVLNQTPVGVKPGTHFHYSNSGYKVLGVLIEELLGLENSRALEERILRPLGMNASTASITNDIRERMATGYAPMYDDRPAPSNCPLAPANWVESLTADGSICSTAPDMAKYVRLFLNRGVYPSGRMLSEQSFSAMVEKVIHPDEDPPTDWYSLGLSVKDSDGHTVLAHSGGMLGFTSYMEADLDGGFGVVALMNAAVESYRPEDVAQFAMKVCRRASERKKLPDVPRIEDPAVVENAREYGGTYSSDGGELKLVAQGKRLSILRDGSRFALERLEKDYFYARAEEFKLFPIRFGRKGGKVVEMFHGGAWYRTAPYRGQVRFRTPRVWESYVGHYRTYNSWFSNFRIVLRKGQLALIRAGGIEEPLTPLSGGWFRMGADKRSPERIRFDRLHKGRTMRAAMPGAEWWRTSAP
jgi:CubicO group peptidase (beta-lactamase class C family)